MDNTFYDLDVDDEDDGEDPNSLLGLLTEPISQLLEIGTIDLPMASSATGATPPAETSFDIFQPMNGIYDFTYAAILNPSQSTGNYMDYRSP
ncbi:hypothetical protein N7448_011421 [Penicillium atrosanguineum]|nr:hypothetical protein N7448_011421 [Penicillium atrosanguineum]